MSQAASTTVVHEQTLSPVDLSSVPMDKLIQATMNASPTQRVGSIVKWLQDNVATIQKYLPDEMKSEAQRFVERAALYIRTKGGKLLECTAESIARCVLEAASMGFALDGKLVYAVPRNVAYINDQGDKRYRMEASCEPDYKALLAFARRIGLIEDGWARLVMQSDTIEIEEINGENRYRYAPDLDAPRDNVAQGYRGVLSVLKTKHGVVWDWMPWTDVLSIRDKSEAYKAGFGPWKDNIGEMGKKSGIKRILKPRTDDIGLMFILDRDAEDYQSNGQAVAAAPESDAPPKRTDQLRDKMRKQMAPKDVGVEPDAGHWPSDEAELMAWLEDGRFEKELLAQTSEDQVDDFSIHCQGLCSQQETVFEIERSCAERGLELAHHTEP